MYSYIGTDLLTLDSKGRIAIPTRLRDILQKQCKGNVVVSAHHNRAVMIYPKPYWERLQKDISGQDDLRLKEMVLGFADDRQIDNQGRLLIKPGLRRYAALQREAHLLGLGDHLMLLSDQEMERRQREDWVDPKRGAGRAAA